MVCSLPRVLHVYIKDYDTKFHLKNVANLTKHASKETSNEFAGSADHEGVVAKCRCLGAQSKDSNRQYKIVTGVRERKERQTGRKRERAHGREGARARERQRERAKWREREKAMGIGEGRREPVPSTARPKMSLHATCKSTAVACMLSARARPYAWVRVSDVLMLVFVCVLRLCVVLLACHPIVHCPTMEYCARFLVWRHILALCLRQ